MPTLEQLHENVEHRLCVKHLYGNGRKKYHGEDMGAAMWSPARASSIPEFQRAMEHLKLKNKDAWRDMPNINPKQWTRAAYDT